MAGAHIGHNSQVGDRVIIANGALLGGHVVVEDGRSSRAIAWFTSLFGWDRSP